jgi:esterase/lipase superfamily enzyme
VLTSVSRVSRQAGAIALLVYVAGCAGLRQSAVTGYDRVSVYFATTREYDASATPDRAFTNTRTKKEWINYGTAEMGVPLPHSEGTQKGIKLERIDLSKGDRQHEFRVLTAAETTNPHRPLIVFVHGFNNTFETAAERAALYAYDLQPDVSSKAAIFSWPSHEKLFGYLADEDSVLVNQDRARQVLEILRTRRGSTSPVVLIGHSMGCRVLTFALREIELIRDQEKTPKLGHPEFAQLILIEPDVDAEYFRMNIARLRAICGHVTVYASSHDNALRFSQFLHDDTREGELGTQGLKKKIDVIDASAAKTDWIGHSYDGPPLFEDIRALLHGATLEERSGKTLEQNPVTKVYRLKKTLS